MPFIQAKGLQAVIPPRNHRFVPRDCDGFVYKKRHLIECFFSKIKHYRRVFSRFDKLARNVWALFASFLLSFGFVEMSTEPNE
jgi:transposase